MARINEHYAKLPASYLFPEIGRRVRAYQAAHPDAKVIRLGIGDVTEPLAPAIVEAMHAAVDEMGKRETFRGYGPEQGYDFLVEAIRQHDYAARGVDIAADEIFVSDGSKCDSGNVQEIFALAAKIAVTDPVYPVYVDSNVMAGRTAAAGPDGRYPGLTYLVGNEANGFQPEPPSEPVDVVYLCSPNNPTGTVATRAQLERGSRGPRAHDAVILFDAAYEAYISDPSLPHSIYEIPGARECALELRSFSKRAGFTGVRCAFMVVPKAVTGVDADGKRVSLNALWARRHTTKFNGASLRGAARRRGGVLAGGARADHARRSRSTWRTRGCCARGSAPRGSRSSAASTRRTSGCARRAARPRGTSSIACSREAQVVGTPGAGFGPAGEGYFRLSAFNSRANIEEAIGRIRRVFGFDTIEDMRGWLAGLLVSSRRVAVTQLGGHRRRRQPGAAGQPDRARTFCVTETNRYRAMNSKPALTAVDAARGLRGHRRDGRLRRLAAPALLEHDSGGGIAFAENECPQVEPAGGRAGGDLNTLVGSASRRSTRRARAPTTPRTATTST